MPAIDKDALGDNITAHVADVSGSSDAVNGTVSTIGFMCGLFRKYKTDPTAIEALADAFQQRGTELAQAGVANTLHEPKDKSSGTPTGQQSPPSPGTTGTRPGDTATVQPPAPTASTPSYVPPSASDAGGAVTDGKTLADKQAETQTLGATGATGPTGSTGPTGPTGSTGATGTALA